ncbi:MAG TPA: TonB-dependent receptor plug domain-containing protein [Pyrinomonadaceae bacterium]|nr:TonB-dependent receptor plug domain-containing protein [Pyrinomonadaceae bacterium]
MIKRILLFLCCLVSSASAQTTSAPAPQSTPPAQKLPVIQERVEVTTTRLPEDPQSVPSAVEVFNGDELRNRGYHDLRSALSFAIGVEVAPGGDAGPASSVPDFWGLKELDAFLLVVDGVPWGGSFNPALTTLDLNDIERIELVRGPAPVTYGATSFVGVIHIVHKDTAAKERSLTVRGGSYGTFGVQFSTPVPLSGKWSSRLSLDAQREGFSDDRTNYRRGHALWRVGRKGNGANRAWFNFDMNWLNQDPASPRVRVGSSLTPLVPVDANNNPNGSFLNDRRFTGAAGFDRSVGSGTWSGTVSLSHSRRSALRGFLEDIDAVTDNARGFRQNIHLTDVYADTHASWKVAPSLTLLLGGDYLHGTGNSWGADFHYTVPLNGVPPVSVEVPSPLDVTTNDARNFFGVYTSIEWRPSDRVRFDAGIRMNVTHETQKHDDPGAGTSDSDRRTKLRPGGSVGLIVTAWKRNQDSVNLYANYRDTFKPAAIDFGIETFSNRLILEPETARSVEGGIKARVFDGRVDVEASGFLMDFKNLVTPISVGGLPALTNAGTQRFKGFESGVSLFMTKDVMAKATYSYHDARFTDYVQDFGGVPTQLAGKRLEMSAHNLAAFGIVYAPERGFLGGVNVYYTGARFLNRRNTAPANGFATIGLSAGYRTPKWELRVDATNLGDRRDPVAESELGDGQYYLMTSRRVVGAFTLHF